MATVIDLTGASPAADVLPATAKPPPRPTHLVIRLHSLDGELHREILLSGSQTSVTFGRASSNPERSPSLRAGAANAYVESPIVSRTHCKLYVETMHRQALYLKDLGSTHGTFLNTNKVPGSRAWQVYHGDRIRLGMPVINGTHTYRPKSFEVRLAWETRPTEQRSSIPTPDESPESRTSRTFHVPNGSDSEGEQRRRRQMTKTLCKAINEDILSRLEALRPKSTDTSVVTPRKPRAANTISMPHDSESDDEAPESLPISKSGRSAGPTEADGTDTSASHPAATDKDGAGRAAPHDGSALVSTDLPPQCVIDVDAEKNAPANKVPDRPAAHAQNVPVVRFPKSADQASEFSDQGKNARVSPDYSPPYENEASIEKKIDRSKRAEIDPEDLEDYLDIEADESDYDSDRLVPDYEDDDVHRDDPERLYGDDAEEAEISRVDYPSIRSHCSSVSSVPSEAGSLSERAGDFLDGQNKTAYSLDGDASILSEDDEEEEGEEEEEESEIDSDIEDSSDAEYDPEDLRPAAEPESRTNKSSSFTTAPQQPPSYGMTTLCFPVPNAVEYGSNTIYTQPHGNGLAPWSVPAPLPTWPPEVERPNNQTLNMPLATFQHDHVRLQHDHFRTQPDGPLPLPMNQALSLQSHPSAATGVPYTDGPFAASVGSMSCGLPSYMRGSQLVNVETGVPLGSRGMMESSYGPDGPQWQPSQNSFEIPENFDTGPTYLPPTAYNSGHAAADALWAAERAADSAAERAAERARSSRVAIADIVNGDTPSATKRKADCLDAGATEPSTSETQISGNGDSLPDAQPQPDLLPSANHVDEDNTTLQPLSSTEPDVTANTPLAPAQRTPVVDDSVIIAADDQAPLTPPRKRVRIAAEPTVIPARSPTDDAEVTGPIALTPPKDSAPASTVTAAAAARRSITAGTRARRPAWRSFVTGAVAGAVTVLGAAAALLATVPADVREEALREL